MEWICEACGYIVASKDDLCTPCAKKEITRLRASDEQAWCLISISLPLLPDGPIRRKVQAAIDAAREGEHDVQDDDLETLIADIDAAVNDNERTEP